MKTAIRVAAVAVLGLGAAALTAAALAQAPEAPLVQKAAPGAKHVVFPPHGPRPNKWGYDYDAKYDAEIAAPEVHLVHYADPHIMLMEVNNPPGYEMRVHGHPYPSVFARDSANPPAGEGLGVSQRFLNPDDKRNGQNWAEGGPPKGLAWPKCTAADPQAPHRPSNPGTYPLHFYRIEFVSLDQDNLAAAKARNLKTVPRKILYENDAVRVVEVTVQPGHSAPKNEAGLPAVLAFDSIPSFDAVLAAVGSDAGRSEAPKGMTAPRCITTNANAPLVAATAATGPIHYYAFAFKRVDGEGLEANWRKWYPYMTKMK